MSRPRSWSEALDRLGRLLASEEEAAEWVRQAVVALWGHDLYGLERSRRALALQKVSGVILRIEDLGYDVVFDRAYRQTIAGIFQEYFRVEIEGPEWRLSPAEPGRPARGEVTSDFGSIATEPDEERLLEVLRGIARQRAARAEKGVERLPAGGAGSDTNPPDPPGISEPDDV